MIRILRSLCQNSNDPDLTGNLGIVLATQVEFTKKPQAHLWEIIQEHAKKYNGDLPSVDWLVQAAKRKFKTQSQEIQEAEALERLNPYCGSNFEALVDQIREDQILDQMKEGLQKSAMKLEDLRGKKPVGDVVSQLTLQTSKSLLEARERTRKNKAQTRGNLTDSEEVRTYIERVHKEHQEPPKTGLLTGYHAIDLATQGLRKKELCLIAGYAGELKSTICRNFLYNMVTMFGYNVVYFSCEVGYDQTQDLNTTIHSCDPRWGRPPIEYKRLKNRALTNEEFDFFKDVAHDLGNNPEYGALEVLQPEDRPFRWSEIVMILQAIDAQTPGGVDAVCLDYYEFVEWDGPRTDDSPQNEMIKASKMLAQGFRGGAGVCFIAPFQINNEGYDYAIRHKGEYLSKHLSTHNQSRRAADVIISTYLGPPDDSPFRQANQVKLCNLKNRDNDPFKPLILQTMLSSGRIYNSTLSVEDDDEMDISEGAEMSAAEAGQKSLVNVLTQL